MTLNFHFWSFLSKNIRKNHFSEFLKYIVDQINQHGKVEIINVFIAEEVFLPFADVLHTVCLEKNIQINYLFGAMSIDTFIESGHHDPSKNRRVFLWPEFFIVRTNYYFTELSIEYDDLRSNKFLYPIICMNGLSHHFRKILVDNLAKYDLVTGNAISWHNIPPNSGPIYEWQYWCPLTMSLTESKNQKGLYRHSRFHSFNQFSVPDEYYDSFLQIVPETTINVAFITEKTAMPLFYKKLFVAVASKHFHMGLVRLGFKLYDEIIDYSFDDVDNTELRINMILKEVKKLILDKSKFSNIYEIIKPKLEYNQQLAIKLSNANSCPTLVMNSEVDYYKYLYCRN